MSPTPPGPQRRSLVTGATGLVGSALAQCLSPLLVLSRSVVATQARLPSAEVLPWSGGPLPPGALREVDTVFHLAGEPVARSRWTAEQKRKIHDSRVEGTRALVAGLRSAKERPRALVSASAVGYYGDRGDEVLDERSGAGAGFLAEVCAAWEREALLAEELGVRVVCVRIGVVLAPIGGALAKMLPPFRLGLGGRLGSGRQWMSWIHLDDLVRLLLFVGLDDRVRGPVCAVAPSPVTNAELTLALGRVLRRPAVLPVPKLALRLALGSMSEMLLSSQRVLPRAAMALGFGFQHPELAEALASVLRG